MVGLKFGECPKHPGRSMLNCPACEMGWEKSLEEDVLNIKMVCNICSLKNGENMTCDVYKVLGDLPFSETKPLGGFCVFCGVCAVAKDEMGNEYVQIFGGEDVMWVNVGEWDGTEI